MNNCTLSRACMRVIALIALSLQAAMASELVYTPINPSFGGNPNNGPLLLNEAQAQNPFKAPTTTLTPLQRFNNNLQQSILNQLSAKAVSAIFGGNNQLTPGTYDTGGYTVKVIQNANLTLTIETTDKSTGATATFDLSSPVM